jgi:hypothetical protein
MTGLSRAVGIGTDAEASSWPSPRCAGSSSAQQLAHKIQGQLGGRREDAQGTHRPAGALEEPVQLCALEPLCSHRAGQSDRLANPLVKKPTQPDNQPPHPRAVNEKPLYRGDRIFAGCADRRCES